MSILEVARLLSQTPADDRCHDLSPNTTHADSTAVQRRQRHGLAAVSGRLLGAALRLLLQIETGTAENYYKAARKRLADEMEQAVRQHVERYCDEGFAEDEFRTEWSRLSSYLLRHGGLENTLRACHQQLASGSQPSRESQAFADTAARLRDQQSL